MISQVLAPHRVDLGAFQVERVLPKADWRAGRMKLPDLDHNEFISLA